MHGMTYAPSPRPTAWITVEAAGALLLSHLLVRLALPLVKAWLFADAALPAAPPEVCEAVRVSIARLSRRMPVRRHCLGDSMAAKLLLARRGYGAVVQLGVGRLGAGQLGVGRLADPTRLFAHAWLESGPHLVAGARQRRMVRRLGGPA